MVEVGTGTAGTRFINTEWPIEEGLTLGTDKLHDRQVNLVAEDEDLTRAKDSKGL